MEEVLALRVDPVALVLHRGPPSRPALTQQPLWFGDFHQQGWCGQGSNSDSSPRSPLSPPTGPSSDSLLCLYRDRKAGHPPSWWSSVSLPISWSASQHPSIYLTSVIKARSGISIFCYNEPSYRGTASAVWAPPEIILGVLSCLPTFWLGAGKHWSWFPPDSYQRNKVTVTGLGDIMIGKPEGEVVAKTTGSKQISSLNIFQKSVTAATQLFCCDGAWIFL